MAVANQILEGIRNQKRRQVAQVASNMSVRTLRPATGRTTPSSQAPTLDPRASYGSTGEADKPTRFDPYGPSSISSPESIEAAKATYTSQAQQQQRPAGPDRTSSSQSAAAAASAAMAGARTQSQGGHYQRPSADYTQGGRSTGSYAPPINTHLDDHRAQQPSYNPAAYANVSGYSPQALIMQQPQALPLRPGGYQALQQMPLVSSAPEPLPIQQQPTQPQQTLVSQRKPAPTATDSGTNRRVGLDNFNFLAVLGKGNFGKVMLAETKATKKLYAIKVLKKEFIIENDEVESTRSEKRVFLVANKEQHPFLLNLHACFQTETRVYFVMEYISGGDLMLHIQRGNFGTRRAQ